MIALTGAGGFLGWHTRVAARALGLDVQPIPLGRGFDVSAAANALSGADRVIHLAGVNRADDAEVQAGNALFAQQLIQALDAAAQRPNTVVYANSTQAGNGGVYGSAKAAAADALRDWCERNGARFIDLRLPNIYGEHGRPFYNSVTATFCHQLAAGDEPRIDVDRELTVLHAQDAADLLLTAETGDAEAVSSTLTVSGLLERLRGMSATYRRGEIPDISDVLDRTLFNTYRSFTVPSHLPIPHVRHEDARGAFVELIRTHGGTGQTSHSTTVPGITRGEHFHRRKVERFTVIEGRARIALRRVLTDETMVFDVEGRSPVSIDMPTMWAHSITNTGDSTLHTVFWTDDIFDPRNPDTFPESVTP